MPGAGREPGRRRGRPGLLLAGAVTLVASTSLLTLALVNPAARATPLVAGLTAANSSGLGQPADDGKGKGKGKGTPTDESKGKGKGTPIDEGKGKGTPADDGKGKGKGTPTDDGKGKGKGTPSPMQATTLTAARQAAGFDVRTLNGVPGAQLESVSVGTMPFATAGGPANQPVVELRYALGTTEITVTEVRDPVALPASLRSTAEDVTIGGSDYFFLPATGDVHSAETRGADGVSLVLNFFSRPAGAPVGGLDRQTAHEVIQHLG